MVGGGQQQQQQQPSDGVSLPAAPHASMPQAVLLQDWTVPLPHSCVNKNNAAATPRLPAGFQ